MEQLVIFLLFVVGSIISAIIQHKKKKAEEQQQRELEELTRRSRGQAQTPPQRTPPRQSPQMPQASLPRTAADWQEQLRRVLEGEPAPPVIIKPVLLPPESAPQRPPVVAAPKKQPAARQISERDLDCKSPLHTSAAGHERAGKLHAAVEERMRVIGEQRMKHTPASSERARPRAHSAFVQRLKRNPRAMREAFVASIIFGPPQGLEEDATQPIR